MRCSAIRAVGTVAKPAAGRAGFPPATRTEGCASAKSATIRFRLAKSPCIVPINVLRLTLRQGGSRKIPPSLDGGIFSFMEQLRFRRIWVICGKTRTLYLTEHGYHNSYRQHHSRMAAALRPSVRQEKPLRERVVRASRSSPQQAHRQNC